MKEENKNGIETINVQQSLHEYFTLTPRAELTEMIMSAQQQVMELQELANQMAAEGHEVPRTHLADFFLELHQLLSHIPKDI